jgi:hypothetical protein
MNLPLDCAELFPPQTSYNSLLQWIALAFMQLYFTLSTHTGNGSGANSSGAGAPTGGTEVT